VADDVQVKFGAETTGLLSGIEQVKAESQSLVQVLNEGFASIGESVRIPLDALAMMKSSLRETAEIAGAVFAIDELKEFTEKMAELGERTLNSAYILGQSVEDYAKLSGAFRIFGGDIDTAQRTLERLALSVQRVYEGNRTSIAAFHNLGISIAEVKAKGDDLISLLTLVIQRYSELKPATRDIGILHEVASRGVDRLAGVLRHGLAGFREALEASKEYAAALKENAGGMDETAEKSNKLSLDLSTLAIQGFGTLKPLIDGTISALDGLVKSMTTAIGWIGKIATAVVNAAADFIHWTNTILGVGAALDATSEAAEKNRQRRGLGTEGFGYADLPPVTVTGTRPAGTESGTGGGAKKARDDRMSIWRDELRQRLEAEGNFFNDSKAEELAFWQQKLAMVSSGTQNDLKLRREVNAQIFSLERALARQTEQEAIEEQTYKMRVADAVYAGKKQHLDAEIKLGKITAEEGIAQERRLLDEKQALDEEYFNAKLSAAEKDLTTSKKILEQEYLAHQEYVNKLQALDDKLAEDQKKAADKAMRPFVQAFDSIGSAFGNLVTGMVTRSGTIQSGLKKLWDAILGDFGKLISEMISKWLASGLMNLGFGASAGAGAGLGSVLAAGFGALFGFSGGGIVPSAAGGWAVPSFQGGGVLSMLHSNEMVLPADISKGLQGMIASGGGGSVNLHFHGPADAPSMERWFNKQMANNSSAVRQMFLSGGLTPRSLSGGR
jgi:hypothetical protein